MIDVTYQMHWELDGAVPIFKQPHVIVLSAWAQSPSNANTVAATIAEDVWSDGQLWDEWFGMDETDARVYVHITSPYHCAGWYKVALRRVVKAQHVDRLATPQMREKYDASPTT